MSLIVWRSLAIALLFRVLWTTKLSISFYKFLSINRSHYFITLLKFVMSIDFRTRLFCENRSGLENPKLWVRLANLVFTLCGKSFSGGSFRFRVRIGDDTRDYVSRPCFGFSNVAKGCGDSVPRAGKWGFASTVRPCIFMKFWKLYPRT
jgi:hypothetical protein